MPSGPDPIDTVLFDFHNTTLDGTYALVGVAHLGERMAARWGVDASAVAREFLPAMNAALEVRAADDFYLLRDVFVDALRRLAATLDVSLDDDELIELDRGYWRAGADVAEPVDGAIETFDRLRDAGVRVGIVSWADEAVFDMLMDRLGFADHVDVAVCSETARSCKPHPGIFRWALDALGADPTTTMFVGDNVDADIVGGNRLGMTTVLVQGSEFSDDLGASTGDPDAVPDHHAGSLRDVADLVLAGRVTS